MSFYLGPQGLSSPYDDFIECTIGDSSSMATSVQIRVEIAENLSQEVSTTYSGFSQVFDHFLPVIFGVAGLVQRTLDTWHVTLGWRPLVS
jgi:hypothetical protein